MRNPNCLRGNPAPGMDYRPLRTGKQEMFGRTTTVFIMVLSEVSITFAGFKKASHKARPFLFMFSQSQMK